MSDNLTERLRPHVGDIISAAQAGDAGAKQIITLHRMWMASPRDPGAPALCEAAFDDWMKGRSK